MEQILIMKINERYTINNLCGNKSVTLDMIKYMVENGADINHKNKMETYTINMLCTNNSVTLDLIKYMVENGANINHKNEDKNTPLILFM
jgi:ankyrin repeat protein